MNHRLVYMSRCYRDLTSAGNKAKTDNEATMQDMGFTNIGLPQKVSRRALTIFFYDLASVVRACLSLRHGDTLLLQYPVKKYFSFLCHVAHLRGAKVEALIHDLGSMRRRKLSVGKEIKRLGNADVVIASNEAMERWLKENGLTSATTALGFFDYRSASKPCGKDEGYGKPCGKDEGYGKPLAGGLVGVVYAGSLAPRKNSFFLKMPDVVSGYELHIYGNGEKMPSLKSDPHFVFHGFTPADDFIAHHAGHFGLVWDGDSLDGCTGTWGEYLRYNSPHKASFYLRAGLPVIVWKEAAIAPLVEKYGVGLTVASLTCLPSVLAQLTPAQYGAMQANARQMAEALNEGRFFRQATLFNS